jgi:hypothetical protein
MYLGHAKKTGSLMKEHLKIIIIRKGENKMENEIMNNEEVLEVVEELGRQHGMSLGSFTAGAATVAVGIVAYKYGVKPLVTKIKNKRAVKKAQNEGTVVETEAQTEVNN